MTVRLWSDEPSPVDLLAFGAVAETAVEAVLDDSLDPIALGISGPWGSGKSTVLELIESDLSGRSAADAEQDILVVRTDPWRYDPAVGAKASLITEVLTTLGQELELRGGASQKAEGALRKLVKRVNWMKALKLAAKTSITLQLPKLEDVSNLVSDEPAEGDEEASARSVTEFRDEFAELMADDDLAHIRRVVVLVDDLDRCLPETVIETLETMRLFLSVPKMSFVIAADEERVADALRERYPKAAAAADAEEPARLYLHKIVQTALRLPALSRFDTEAFLLLLLIQKRPETPLDEATFKAILGQCTDLRVRAGTLDELTVPDDLDISEEMRFAARLTPMLYERLQGSPRRVKRFLGPQRAVLDRQSARHRPEHRRGRQDNFYWTAEGLSSFEGGYGPRLGKLGPVKPLNVDFVRLAALVFAADRTTPRKGGGSNWSQRTFALRVPVGDPAPWQAISDEMAALLAFLTGDEWSLDFQRARTPKETVRNQSSLITPQRVVLVSGGAEPGGVLLPARPRHERPVQGPLQPVDRRGLPAGAGPAAVAAPSP